jgi:type II secretory pathway predicted ATPase ExeA
MWLAIRRARNGFRLMPDQSATFLHDSYAGAIETATGAMRRQEVFVVVTGAPGTGKTTLIDDLAARFRADHFVVGQLANPRLAGDDLLRLVSFAFRIRARTLSKTELLPALLAKFVWERKRGKRTLLIVDDAQDLTPSALDDLRLLCNLATEHLPLVHLLLVGQEELWDTLRSPHSGQMQQLVLTSCRIRPLVPRETREYVAHKLTRGGWAGDPRISGEALSLVHQATGGVPQLVNLAMGRLLVHASLERLHSIEAHDAVLVLAELEQENLAIQPKARLHEWATQPGAALACLGGEQAGSVSVADRRGMVPTDTLPRPRSFWSRAAPHREHSEATDVASRRIHRRWESWIFGAVAGILILSVPADVSLLSRQSFLPETGRDGTARHRAALAKGHSHQAPHLRTEQAALSTQAVRRGDTSWDKQAPLMANADHQTAAYRSSGAAPSTRQDERTSRPVQSTGRVESTPRPDLSIDAYGPSKEDSGVSDSEAATRGGADADTAALPALGNVLEQAERALAENRLTLPKGDNAYDYYRSVLARDPGNAQAMRGLHQIVGRYRTLARAQLRKGNLRNARRLAQRGLTVRRDDPRLRAILYQSEARETAPRDGGASLITRLTEWLRSGDTRKSLFLSE